MALLLRTLGRQCVLSRPQYSVFYRHAAPVGTTAKEEMNKSWMVCPHDYVHNTQRNWNWTQWSCLSLCGGSAGLTRKLPLLPGLDPLAVGRPLSHWSGQVRHCFPRVLSHLQWHPPLVLGRRQRLQNPRGLPQRLRGYWPVHHHHPSFAFALSSRREDMRRKLKGIWTGCTLGVLRIRSPPAYCSSSFIKPLNKGLYCAVCKQGVVMFCSLELIRESFRVIKRSKGAKCMQM